MPRHTRAEMLEFEIFCEGATSSESTIVIASFPSSDGGDLLTASGTAKRGRGDKHTPGVGQALATARALENLARKLRRELKDFL